MTKKHNARNERIKRRYFEFLKHAKRQSELSIDKAAAAIERFDAWNRRKDFRQFHVEQAMAFKVNLEKERHPRTGRPLSIATLAGILRPLRAFVIWLADQEGYRKRIRYSDAEYFNISRKDQRLARSGETRPAPSPEQVRHVLSAMPSVTEIEKRNRAIVALLTLTGVRDGALITLRIKHVDVADKSLFQNAREVKTKFAKTMRTYFTQGFPLAEQVLADWIRFLTVEKLRGPDDPLFPKTEVGIGPNGGFQAVGLSRGPWRGASPVRKIIREAFENAGLISHGPHSFRHMLIRLAQRNCRSLEEFKAWSENIGHEDMLTSLRSYGQVPEQRRRALILGLTDESDASATLIDPVY